MVKIKAHSLLGRISVTLLGHAFGNVRRNRGAAGIDKVSIKMFQGTPDLGSWCLPRNLDALCRDLKNGTFRPLPLRRVHIDKGGGKTRPLGIPAVRDRVAQEALRQILSPLFERIFHDDSFGFRPARNCHMAVTRVLELRRQGYTHVLDADIKGFFDNIPHDVIMQGVATEVADGSILRLIEQFLKSGVMVEGVFHPTGMGTPQGGVISPLLANITLNSLDWCLHNAGFRFVRYADDFVVLCQSQLQTKEAHDLVQQELTRLGLTLSAEKTSCTTFKEGFTFLGFDISSRAVRMRPKSVAKFKTNIRTLTVRNHNLDAKVIRKINAVVRGTANYFATSFSHVNDVFRTLDRWLRMRIRCMKFKAKRRSDNWRLRLKHLRRQGLIFLTDARANARAPPAVETLRRP